MKTDLIGSLTSWSLIGLRHIITCRSQPISEEQLRAANKMLCERKVRQGVGAHFDRGKKCFFVQIPTAKKLLKFVRQHEEIPTKKSGSTQKERKSCEEERNTHTRHFEHSRPSVLVIDHWSSCFFFPLFRPNLICSVIKQGHVHFFLSKKMGLLQDGFWNMLCATVKKSGKQVEGERGMGRARQSSGNLIRTCCILSASSISALSLLPFPPSLSLSERKSTVSQCLATRKVSCLRNVTKSNFHRYTRTKSKLTNFYFV